MLSIYETILANIKLHELANEGLACVACYWVEELDGAEHICNPPTEMWKALQEASKDSEATGIIYTIAGEGK